MICFAAFTPHTPLLLKSIGKENTEKLKKTLEAMDKLKASLEASEPDVIITISSHSIKHENAFSINLHDEYHLDLKDFGDLTTTKEFAPDLELITQIRRELHKELFPLTLDSSATLDYGTAIPLYLLDSKSKIVPISYSKLSKKKHVEFGRHLKEIAMDSQKRIAVIASGDLSHCLSSDSPVEFHKDGAVFDEEIQEAIRQQSLSHILGIDDEVIKNASECSYKPLLILFGILERINARPEIHSYEAPFGVGYLAAEFHL